MLAAKRLRESDDDDDDDDEDEEDAEQGARQNNDETVRTKQEPSSDEEEGDSAPPLNRSPSISRKKMHEDQWIENLLHSSSHSQSSAEGSNMRQMTSAAKDILGQLLGNPTLFADDNERNAQPDEYPSDVLAFDSMTELPSSTDAVKRQLVLDEAAYGKGRVSLFCSILRVFEEHSSPTQIISAETIIQKCRLSMRPCDVPPEFDAAEMILAALHFLSTPVPALTPRKEDEDDDDDDDDSDDDAEDSNTKTTSLMNNPTVASLFPFTPLLASTNESNPYLEQRNYFRNVRTPNGSWTVQDVVFRRKVLNLEKAFMSSTTSFPSRLRACPNLSSDGETTHDPQLFLMLTGKLLPSATNVITTTPATSTKAPANKKKKFEAS